MSSYTIESEAIEREFEAIDEIVCYECGQTRIRACLYLDGECPLDLL
jgi:hypothetical protein